MGRALLLVKKDPPRTNSLLVTIYGDVIWPHGGNVWVGSLVKAAAMFGISGKAVRTATSRLVKAGWLRRLRSGKNSDYQLTALGQEHCAEAAHRIYDTAHGHDWLGGWQSVVLPVLSVAKRKKVWDELAWRGFARIGTRVLLRPTGDDDIREVMANLGLDSRAAVFDATSDSHQALAALARDNWGLEDIESRYAAFLRDFNPVVASIAKHMPDDDVAFVLRVLMIHRFRRILLKDPMLPARLLPKRWHGDKARDLCGEAYRLLLKPSERYVAGNMRAEGRPLPADYVALGTRFARKQKVRMTT